MKKFLCYDTNDAASGKINVDNRGVLKPNSTVPSTNGAPYQQLVTDGDGNVKWEDKPFGDVESNIPGEIYEAGYTEFDNVVIGNDLIISEEIWNALLTKGSSLIINDTGEQYEFSRETDVRIEYTGDGNPSAGNLFVCKDSPKAYFYSARPDATLGVKYMVSVPYEYTKQIDPKYINDMYYTKTTPGSDGPIVTFKAYENSVSPLTLSEPVIVDAPYTVKVGNDEYKTIGTTDGDNLYIQVDKQGSLPAQGTLIVTDPINNPLVAMWQGNKTNKKIEIIRESQEEVKQIDPKYIPPTTVIVNVTANEDGTFSADKTFDKVKALIDSGFNVKCRFNMFEAPCIVYTTENTNTVIGFELVDVSESFGYIAIFTPDRVVVNEINVDDLLLPPINNNYGFLQAINGVWEISPDIIIPSSTSGSSKKFKITVDDSGTISATEV